MAIKLTSLMQFAGGGGGGALEIRNTALVAKNGNDVTGTVGDWSKPYLTINAAVAACVAGQSVWVAPGDYTPNANLWKDGVNLYALGRVNVNTSGVNIAITSPAYSWRMAGDFNLVNCPVLITDPTDYIEFDIYRSDLGFTITGTASGVIVNVRCKLLNEFVINGLVCDENSVVHLWAGLLDSPATAISIVDMERGNVFISGDVVAADVGVNVNDGCNIVIDASVRAGEYALFTSGKGGNIITNGVLRGDTGAVINGWNALNAYTFAADIVINGNATGSIFAVGDGKITINGTLFFSQIVVDSPDAVVLMNGAFSAINSAAFDVANGRLIWNGVNARVPVLYPSLISGGVVEIKTDFSASLGVYGGTLGLFRLNGGRLVIAAKLENTDTGIGAACVDYISGELVLNGAVLKTDGTGVYPIMSGSGTAAALFVYGGIENLDSNTLQENGQYIDLNGVPFVPGDVFDLYIDGSPYSYTVLPGNTITDVINGLVAASALDPIAFTFPGAVGYIEALSITQQDFVFQVQLNSVPVGVLTVYQYANKGIVNNIVPTVLLTDANVI